MDSGKQGGGETEKKDAAADGKAGAPAAGGLKAWLPLIITALLMPGLAYATTTFVLLPKLQKSLGGGGASEEAHADAGGGHGAPAAHGKSSSHGAKADSHGKPANAKGKITVPMREKVLVNVSGSMGTRFLVVNFSLVSANTDLKQILEENEAQIRDLSASVLSSKTIVDLEKPGAKNLIRSELITVFNTALGAGLVQEIYFTEFAVQ
jgi:flagellar FliL protein